MPPRLTAADLAGKTLDVHAHVGLSLKAYAHGEYPWAQTVEGLYYQQLAGGVDVNVVFPFTADLYYDLAAVASGELRPAAQPLSAAPYVTENRTLFTEVYHYCPELTARFLPFVCIHPTEQVSGQLAALEQLAAEFPIYGIKVSPVLCRAPVQALLTTGRPFLEFARAHDLPLLFHTTGDANEGYSQPRDAFAVIDAYPDLRFCLAHCICFHRAFLERAAAAPNVWVDTAALKIQVQMVDENGPLVPAPAERFPGDYRDHRALLQQLVAAYPEMMVWGTDSPAYAYICRRLQAAGHVAEFRLKGTYGDEVAALRSLSPEQQRRISNANALRFLFGPLRR